MKSFFKKKITSGTKMAGFTLVELIVSVTITSILFVFLFSFVLDSLNEIKFSKQKTSFFSNFSSFTIKMNNFSNSFPNFSLIKDFPNKGGMDIVLLKNTKGTFGIAVGVVGADTMKFSKNYKYYGEKVLGYVELEKSDLDSISLDEDKIYDYKIFKDKIFPNIYVKDFQVDIYNGGKILELSIDLFPFYSPGYDGINWSELDKRDFFKLVLNY